MVNRKGQAVNPQIIAYIGGVILLFILVQYLIQSFTPKSELDKCNSDKVSLQQTVDLQQKQIADLNQQIEALKKRIADLEAENNYLKGNLTKCQEDVKVLQANLTNVTALLNECHNNYAFHYSWLFFKDVQFNETAIYYLITLSIIGLVLMIPINIGFKLFKIVIKKDGFKKFYNGFMFGYYVTAFYIFVATILNNFPTTMKEVLVISFGGGLLCGLINYFVYKAFEKD